MDQNQCDKQDTHHTVQVARNENIEARQSAPSKKGLYQQQAQPCDSGEARSDINRLTILQKRTDRSLSKRQSKGKT
jgi:hypothetical protein